MSDISGKVALVTGAGSGIGRETALALAREGAHLIVCDIDADALHASAADINRVGKCLLAEQVDVSDLAAMTTFAERVHGIVPALDILVNNAGVGLVGSILTTSDDDWRWIVGINLWGVIHGCRLFVPNMAARGSGHVVNVSSMLGYSPSADILAYTTTKFGVFGLTLAMANDLDRHNIRMTVVCPGLINTNITRTTRITGRDDVPEVRERIVRFYQRRNYGPERVARAIVRAIRRNKLIVPVSPEAWFAYYFNRLWPAGNRWFWRQLARRVEG